jgi:hypothetical protein
MIADSNGDVRKNAFAAVGRIRSAAAQVSQAAEWPVAGSCAPKDPRTGQRRVSVAVVTADGSESPRVLPVQFMLSENGQPVWSYRVGERPAPEAMSVIFLFPRKLDKAGTPWDQGALRCLNWKRSSGPLVHPALLRRGYPIREPRGPGTPVVHRQRRPGGPRFPGNLEANRLHRLLDRRAPRRAARQRPLRGKRHMIVLAPGRSGR